MPQIKFSETSICNAHNHPPGCECGWGGVWYGGSSDSAEWLFNRIARPRSLGPQLGTRSSLSGSFVNPNSNCPVCGASVYFYQSPYGGRVFFDALGPPWPKHPCTSTFSSLRGSANRPIPWHQDGWHSLANVEIHKSGQKVDRYSIVGTSRGKPIQLEFVANEIVMAEVVRYRPIGMGHFELSILDFDAVRSEWAVWQGNATTQRMGLDTTSVNLTRFPIHSHVVTPKAALRTPAKLPVAIATTNAPSRDTFMKCSDCSASVKLRNFAKHLRLIHHYSPEQCSNRVSARLLGATTGDA